MTTIVWMVVAVVVSMVVTVIIAVEVVVTVVVNVGELPSNRTTEYDGFKRGSLRAIGSASKPLLNGKLSLDSLDMGRE